MKRSRLLVVDDDDSTRHALKLLLTRRGWDVLTASTVAEGLAMLDLEPFCVILDLNFPDGGGETILREIRLSHPSFLVAVCSASSSVEQWETVRSLEPDLMMAKPINLSLLFELLEVSLVS